MAVISKRFHCIERLSTERREFLMIGTTLGHYQITDLIGKGGMGVVYRARDTSLGRNVALKFLPDELRQDETARKRFVREARSAAVLDHPYICSIHEVGEAEGKSFIVMEYLEGQTLRDRLAQGNVALREAIQWAVEIAEALAIAHEKGIIHRDLKPANIMLLQTGHAKVMDFGLAKQMAQELGSQEDTLTGALTREGTTVGTLPYMSPEQILGTTLDNRSDLFSFGVVLYEMMTGINPFKKESGFKTAEAILREDTAAVSKHRSDIPPQLEAVVGKLLAKEPEDRYQTAREVMRDLRKTTDEAFGKQIIVTRSAFAGLQKALKRPVYFFSLILILAAAAYFSVQGIFNYRKARWAREVAPKQVEQLLEQKRPLAAARLLKQAEQYAPDSKELNQFRTLLLVSPISIQTEPPGADIYVRDYADAENDSLADWELLGRTPYSSTQFPSGYYRFRLVKEEFEPLEVAGPRAFSIQLKLHSKPDIPPGMVWVPPFQRGEDIPPAAPAESAEFWIDKYEVTNRQFKEFVDAGGYQKQGYWKMPFIKDGKPVSWKDAMAAFCDHTGRPGPATWEFGTFPEGQADFPVGGISWYEAAAYAEFAGKSLPTLYHWKRAGSISLYADMLRLSNFSAQGPAKVGANRGLGDFGTFDMAGNLKEWCFNEVEGSRYLMGGAWNEPEYQFNGPDARQPFERAATFGVRCVKYTALPAKALTEPMGSFLLALNDRRKDKPADDQAFSIYLGLYSYDKTDLKAAVESTDETSSPYWRKERVTFQAAYGGERVIAELYLPKNATPPFQTAILMPGADAFIFRSLIGVEFRNVEFIVRFGRAVMVPHCKGMLERGPFPNVTGKPNLLKETGIQFTKDMGRSIDYLETRPDIDTGKLAYLGVSIGAVLGPLMVAVEPRFKVAILAAGGSRERQPDEIDPWNFASRVKIPVLMLNGRSDFTFPLETSQIPLFQLLGTPEKDKRRILYEGAHEIFYQIKVYRDMMEWLDRYLGPVSIKPNQERVQ